MIDPAHYGLIEMAFTTVLVLGLGGWGLVSINREIARDKAKKAASEEGARHAVGEHGLDDR
jgi:tRNA(Ile)-lysidine synthase TilS/MesJ